MKKTIISIFAVLFALLVGCTLFLSIRDMNKPNKESIIDGKDVSKEEYIFKDDLLNIGYSIDEITSIQNKLSLSDVKSYLLGNKKFENIVSFIYNPYFNISNLTRYISYYKKNPDYSFDQVVLNVEIGLDHEFYTNVKVIDNYYDIDALVNKYNKLPEEIKYDDLVTIQKPYSNNESLMLRSVAYNSLLKMIDSAKKDNIDLFVVSAYRTWEKQNSLFNNSQGAHGLKHALLYSAKPGHSEHQLGLAVDLNSTNESFSNTKEYEWLRENAYKYGFIERYPKGKESITGYGYEPWHYRYLGEKITTKMLKDNITYEEYLVKYK